MPRGWFGVTIHWASHVKKILFNALHVLKYLLGPATMLVVVWYNWHKSVNGKEVGISSIFEREPLWGPLVLALIICTASTILTFIRWYLLVCAQDLPFTPGKAIQLGLLGTFLSTFLPGSVAGDIPKMYVMTRNQKGRRTVAVATIIIDRLVGLCGLIWLAALLGGIFWLTGKLQTLVQTEEGIKALEYIVWTSWMLVSGSLAFWFLLGFLPLDTTTRWIGQLERIPKLGYPLAELCRSTLMYRYRSRAVALSMLLAMIGHAGFVLTFYFGSLSVNSLDHVPSWQAHFLIVPVGATAESVFPTPGGMGGGELIFGTLYSWLGSEFNSAAPDPVSPEGLKARIMVRAVSLLLATLGFIVYLRMRATLQAVANAQQIEAPANTATPVHAIVEQPVHRREEVTP